MTNILLKLTMDGNTSLSVLMEKLYVPVGAPCNICESKDPVYASITRMNADGSGKEVFANGVRNSVGFTWHPVTKQMWFTDNGRDMLGDDIPSCELNTASKEGLHFGYPYCHEGSSKIQSLVISAPALIL